MSVTGTRSWGLFGPDMDDTTVDRSNWYTCMYVAYIMIGYIHWQYMRIGQYIMIGLHTLAIHEDRPIHYDRATYTGNT